MLRNNRVPIYCTLCFILGCTLTISVVKYEECADLNGDDVTAQGKFPRDSNSRFLASVNSHGAHRFRKTISSFLIVVVMSSPDNVRQRNSIRETWATYGHSDEVQYFFFVGSKDLKDDQMAVLVKEYENNKDLVLLSETVDTYEGLTTKILLSLTWLYKSADFSFMLKCDDDSFVRTTLVLKELKDSVRVNPKRRLYWGFFDGRAHVRRGGKWADVNWVICDRYLPYALGGGYILSKELVDILADRASLLEPYVNEDVAVGAWLSTVRGLERKHDGRFDTEYRSRGCKEDYIITHKVSPEMMRTFFSSLTTTGKFCPSGEFRTINSYIYDWNVPPSRCCDRRNSSVP